MTRIQRRVQVLLALGALGAAGMILGGEGWLGIDFGPVAATLLYAALWVLVVSLAKHAGEVFPEEWSLAERQAWVGLVFVALIGSHMLNLLSALPDLGAEADRLRNSATRPLWTNLGLLFVGWIIVASMLRKQDAGGVELDERDLRVAHTAARFADGALTSLIVCLVVTLVALPEYSRTWLRPLIAANVLIALLLARALVENIYTVLRYRRERG
jgi:hypothetical protein